MTHILSNVRLVGWGRTRFRCHMCGQVGQFHALIATECPNTLGIEPGGGKLNRRLSYAYQEVRRYI